MSDTGPAWAATLTLDRNPTMTAFTLPLILALSAANPAPAAPAPVPSKGAQTMTQPRKLETATLAGGCFWCLDAVFSELKGVDKVVSGFSGGAVVDPSYEQVCTGVTGHAEVVQITFDPSVISYHDLLDVFFTVHDPTTPNRQGADVGTQYRSAIFTHSPEQQAIAEKTIAELNAKKVWDRPIVTRLE